MLHASYRQCNARAGHAILRSNALPIQLPIQLRQQTTGGSPQPYRKTDSLPPEDTPALEKKVDPEVPKPSLHPINPPSSTLPPPLNLPTRSPSTSKPKHLLNVGKTYLAFYKTGLKALYQNTKLIRASTNPHFSLFASTTSLQQALADEKITRADYHLIVRTQNDALRIPLFMVVFACCSEFTPLLVPFISPVIPKCVWLPVQWEKMRRKGEDRRRRWLERGRIGVEEAGHQVGAAAPVTLTPSDALLGVKPSGKDVDVRRYYGMVGVRINAWPRLLDRIYSWSSPFTLLERLSETARGLWLDDLAIKREGGVAALVDEEVKMAMDARGQDVLGKGMQELRDALEECLQTHNYLSI